MNARHLLTALLLSALLGLFPAPTSAPAADPPSKTWSGNWNNKKYNTNGPLTCRATPKDRDNWDASFSGKGLGKPFNYNAPIKLVRKNNRLYLTGTTDIDGDAYRWTGYVQGKTLVGSFRSASGNNGTFTLQEQ